MQQRFDHSEAVLIGKPLKRDGESRSYGHPANVHVVEVEQVLNGGLGHGPVCVASMPVTCGQTYPDGDPLDDGERKLIFLTDKHVQWFTMTPDRGTVQFPAGTALPFKTG